MKSEPPKPNYCYTLDYMMVSRETFSTPEGGRKTKTTFKLDTEDIV